MTFHPYKGLLFVYIWWAQSSKIWNFAQQQKSLLKIWVGPTQRMISQTLKTFLKVNTIWPFFTQRKQLQQWSSSEVTSSLLFWKQKGLWGIVGCWNVLGYFQKNTDFQFVSIYDEILSEKSIYHEEAILFWKQNKTKTSLSWVVPSSVIWAELIYFELSWGWGEELALN